MENASKALIMAASILISVLVLSLAVYLFTAMGNYTKEQEEKLFNKKLSEFNSNFLKYENAMDVTAHDIVSVANLAKENNKYYGVSEGESSYITIIFNGQKVEKEADMNNFIKLYAYDANGKTINYRCTKIEVDSITGRVNKVIFQK